MKGINFIIPVLLLVSGSSCFFKKTKQEKYLLGESAKNYVILQENYPLPKNASFANLEKEEVEVIFSSMQLIIENHNQEAKEEFIIDFDKFNYNFQIVPFYDEEGVKNAWFMGFCNEEDDFSWRKQLMLFEDGGGCVFEFYINMETRQISKFYTNGIA